MAIKERLPVTRQGPTLPGRAAAWTLSLLTESRISAAHPPG